MGDPGLVPIAARCTAIGGYISCFAGFPAGTLAQIDPNLIHYRELTVSGSANATLADYAAAVTALSTGALDLSALITHEFALTEVDAALDARPVPRRTQSRRTPRAQPSPGHDSSSRPRRSATLSEAPAPVPLITEEIRRRLRS